MEKFSKNPPKIANFHLILAKPMENFNLDFQKLSISNQKSQKLGKNGNLNYFPTAIIRFRYNFHVWASGPPRNH